MLTAKYGKELIVLYQDGDFIVTHFDLFVGFATITGHYFNLVNYIGGFLQAKSKSEALNMLVPIIIVYIQALLIKYSQVFETHSMLLLIVVGMNNVIAVGITNISTSCCLK